MRKRTFSTLGLPVALILAAIYTTSAFSAVSASQPPFSAVRLAAGGAHSLGILTNGSVWSWGSNALGQLGDATTAARRTTPVPVAGLSGVFVAVAAGTAHSLALRDDGVVFAWGLNFDGQVGDGTTTLRRQPVRVVGLNGVVAIAAGAAHSLALRSDGTVVAWGANLAGQLGDGTTNRRLKPVPVSTLTTAATIAAGAFHSLAVLHDGSARAWGANAVGTAGRRDADESQDASHRVGSVGCDRRGRRRGAQPGAHERRRDQSVGRTTRSGSSGTRPPRGGPGPSRVLNVPNAVAIAAGAAHSLAVTTTGFGRAWGANDVGQLGDGTTTRRLTPVAITEPPSAMIAVAAGATHSLAASSDNTAWSWGLNLFGQLGDGVHRALARADPDRPVG